MVVSETEVRGLTRTLGGGKKGLSVSLLFLNPHLMELTQLGVALNLVVGKVHIRESRPIQNIPTSLNLIFFLFSLTIHIHKLMCRKYAVKSFYFI